jgi:hypothetical protein
MDLYSYVKKKHKKDKLFYHLEKFLNSENYKHVLVHRDKIVKSLENKLIIQSFYNFMEWLFDQNDITFTIVFRTYASIKDIKQVIKEFNSFCINKQRKDKCIELDNESIGIYDGANNKLKLGIFNKNEIAKTVVSGYSNIYKFIKKRAGKTTFIRDDFNYWNNAGKICTFGKLLVLEKNANPNYIQVFMDDNADSIVNIRDTEGKITSLIFKPHYFCFVKTVDILKAVLQKNYFVSKVKKILNIVNVCSKK